jgi:hypothetical protein
MFAKMPATVVLALAPWAFLQYTKTKFPVAKGLTGTVIDIFEQMEKHILKNI